MKKYNKFASKIAQCGFYIILFLCISAIGISGYVFYLARDTKDVVMEETDIESSLKLPEPVIEMPDITQTPEPVTPKQAEVKTEKKVEEVPKPSPAPKKEEVVYTMAVNGSLSAPFSGSELVKSKTMGDWRIHSGVDIKAEEGQEVAAIADGKILSVAHDSMMGNTVRIEHTGGLISIYANLADDIPKKVGDDVKSGEVIGKIGNSALSECMEESHLHLEVWRDGNPIDPLSLFPAGED